MLNKRLFLASFLLIFLLISGSIPIQAQQGDFNLEVSTDNLYYLLGDTVRISVYGEPSTLFTLAVYNPVDLLFSNTYTLSVNGYSLITLPVQQGALTGTYTFIVSNIQGEAITKAEIVSLSGLTPVDFPFIKTYGDLQYIITARAVNITKGLNSLRFSYPKLPVTFDSIIARANNQLLTIRLRKNAITVDLSYVFLRSGIKLVINGTLPEETTFSFQFADIGKLKRRLYRIQQGFLTFDFSDIQKMQQAFTYQDGLLTVTIPETFRIDPYIFEDGFESNDFSAWTGTYTSTGETATVTNENSHHGDYHAKFTSNDGASNEYAYVYETPASSYSELYARAYFLINISSISTCLGNNDDTINLIRIQATSPSTTSVAWGGFTNSGGTIYWYVQESKGWTSDLGDSAPTENTWYCVEMYVKIHGSEGMITLWVDGELQCNLTGIDTNDWGNAQTCRFGIAHSYYCNTAITVFVDCAVIDDEYIGIEEAPEVISITFYYSSGLNLNQFRVNCSIVANNTNIEYANETVLELIGVTYNSSYLFSNFTWTNGNSTTNPYNYTVLGNNTIWLYIRDLAYEESMSATLWFQELMFGQGQWLFFIGFIGLCFLIGAIRRNFNIFSTIACVFMTVTYTLQTTPSDYMYNIVGFLFASAIFLSMFFKLDW